MPYLTTDRLAATADFVPVEQGHWFGTTELPGESTEHGGLRIVPDVHAEPMRGARHQVRYTGYWSLIHIPSGTDLSAGHWMPLPWLRRFARLLASCGIEWDQITGDPRRIVHPQNIIVRSIGAHVLDCWRRGVPVGPGIGISLHADVDGYMRMQCANRHCEDDFAVHGHPTVLGGMGEDGQDDALSRDLDELLEIARECGWSKLSDTGPWLCEVCTASHQPAPKHIARRFQK